MAAAPGRFTSISTMARQGCAGRAQGACRQSWGYNYLETASADSAGTFTVAQSAAALCATVKVAGGGTSVHACCVYPREKVRPGDILSQTPYGDLIRPHAPSHFCAFLCTCRVGTSPGRVHQDKIRLSVYSYVDTQTQHVTTYHVL